MAATSPSTSLRFVAGAGHVNFIFIILRNRAGNFAEISEARWGRGWGHRYGAVIICANLHVIHVHAHPIVHADRTAADVLTISDLTSAWQDTLYQPLNATRVIFIHDHTAREGFPIPTITAKLTIREIGDPLSLPLLRFVMNRIFFFL